VPWCPRIQALKYADDTMLLVTEHTDIGTDIEFNHVKAWAAINGLTLNLNKTKEIVFRRPRAQSSSPICN